MHLEKIVGLRKYLHKNPELSGNEINTSKKIVEFISEFSPSEIIKDIGGYGIAFIFDSGVEGPALLLRSELDALPIQEKNTLGYRSINENTAHLCGHDGHMAVLAGTAEKIKIKRGKVILLFQPAEETGEGAERILNDKKFQLIKPDFVFAFHNLPGYEKNKIVIKDGIFSSASKGMVAKLTGKTSHAAEPEKGRSPSNAVASIIQMLNSLVNELPGLNDFCLITIVHAKIGERAFGTTPGYAEVMATLRSYRNEDMELLTGEAERSIKEIADSEGLQLQINYTEEFSAAINDKKSTEIIRDSAEENNFQIERLDFPFKWSEDFGRFTEAHKGALFGIGAGIDQPDLHNENYDFPDEIIETGIKMYLSIIKKILS
jgi:amidohydrolase